MFSEERFILNRKMEQEPMIIIRRSAEAPPEVKANPFYDEEYWGNGVSPDNIYLPDSDEALSFAMAGHEIGHLVKGELPTGLDNFESQKLEEQRAWDVGWPYIKPYLEEYYHNSPETIHQIERAFERIKVIFAEAMDFSKGLYLESGTLDGLSEDEKGKILKERREKFFSERGTEFKKFIDRIKQEKIGVRPDWNKFVEIITKAVRDILKNNKKG